MCFNEKKEGWEYCHDHTKSIEVCNIICLSVAGIFFILDLISIYVQGVEEYFDTQQNWLDFTWFPL